VGSMAKRTTIIERRETGPTAERLLKAENHFHVGDDKQGGKIYQLCDNPMDRLYSRLTRSASTHEENSLRREYAALLKYRHHWNSAGLEPSMGSVDLNRIFAADASNMSGMAKTERQFNHRDQYRRARDIIGHRMGIVLDNVVCAEWSLEIAGYSVGYGSYKQGRKTYSSPYRAREEATKLLRGAGTLLAIHWGFT
jgi:hypothetical protein